MTDNPLARLCDLGQSVWYDFIRRDLMATGTLARYIEEDRLRGMTSNPTIFQKAIADSDLYDADIRDADPALDLPALFEQIAIGEIQSAADCFRPVYDSTDGQDGYVSIEVAPTLARDTEPTITEARRIWSSCDRPNVMIKIPGTSEGLPAIETCLYEGINVNVTLLFSEDRYREVMEIWLRALERRAAEGKPIDRIASVASFFVSRVDTSVDRAIDEALPNLSADDAARLVECRHKLGIANARVAYLAWEDTVRESSRFAVLRQKGALYQRPLWASTSAKDPALPDIYYIEALAGPDSVNTVPPATYDAYRDHGDPRVRISDDVDAARLALQTLEEFDVDFAAITDALERDGVKAFEDSYQDLLKAIAVKRELIRDS